MSFSIDWATIEHWAAFLAIAGICVGSGEAIEKSDIAFSGTERRRSPENLRLVEIVRLQRLERNRKKIEGEGQ